VFHGLRAGASPDLDLVQGRDEVGHEAAGRRGAGVIDQAPPVSTSSCPSCQSRKEQEPATPQRPAWRSAESGAFGSDAHMLTFTPLIVACWLGWSAPNLSRAGALKRWDIVEIGRGMRHWKIGREDAAWAGMPIAKGIGELTRHVGFCAMVRPKGARDAERATDEEKGATPH